MYLYLQSERCIIPSRCGIPDGSMFKFAPEQSEERNDEDDVRDAVLVTDADSETGQVGSPPILI